MTKNIKNTGKSIESDITIALNEFSKSGNTNSINSIASRYKQRHPVKWKNLIRLIPLIRPDIQFNHKKKKFLKKKAL